MSFAVKRSAATGGSSKRTRFSDDIPPMQASGSRSGPTKRARRSNRGNGHGGEDDDDDDDDEGDEDEANAFLEDDLTESNKRSRAAQRQRRTELRGTEGYDSDSSNDEDTGVVPSRNQANDTVGGGDDDADDDMFGGGGESEEKDSASAATPGVGMAGEGDSKPTKYMSLGDIEGQEFENASSSSRTKKKGKGKAKSRDDMVQDDDEDPIDDEDAMADSDSDSEDEERKKAEAKGLDGPMGFEMTAFNMRKELREGKMTADGEEYVEEDKDPFDDHDRWLEGTDKQAIKKARRAHRERERLEKEREEREAREGADQDREERVMKEMVALLERGETVLEGLQRLGKEAKASDEKHQASDQSPSNSKKKKSWFERQKERKEALEKGDPEHGGSDPHGPFARMSELVSTLNGFGHLDVYSMTRESLQRLLPREPTPAPASAEPSQHDSRMFQYRFSKPYLASMPESTRPVERETFGPFPLDALIAWRNTGFFGGPACENVEIRQVEGTGTSPTFGEWGSWERVVGA